MESASEEAKECCLLVEFLKARRRQPFYTDEMEHQAQRRDKLLRLKMREKKRSLRGQMLMAAAEAARGKMRQRVELGQSVLVRRARAAFRNFSARIRLKLEFAGWVGEGSWVVRGVRWGWG